MAQYKEFQIWGRVEPVIYEAIVRYLQENCGTGKDPISMSKLVRKAVILYLIEQKAITEVEIVKAVA